MRVPDHALEELREQGFCIVPGFLAHDELAAAVEGLWLDFPTPETYFADPDAHPSYARSQFAGLRTFPARSWAVNRLALHPDLVDAVERFLGSTDLQLYKGEIWAKYAGAVDYDQPLHRDFGNHSLVVPRRDGYAMQVTAFILLSDVTALDAPTHVVSLEHSRDVELVPDHRAAFPNSLPTGALVEHEVAVTGPAGTLFLYRTDVLHRGTDFAAPGRSRFAVLADYQVRGPTWAGKVAWPDHALQPAFVEVMERTDVRQRDLFGFPRPGDPYWNAQTWRDVGRRYPGMDVGPYRPEGEVDA